MSDFFTLKALKELNDERRKALLEEASSRQTEFDKIAHIVITFLRDYKYDYSVLKSREEFNNRRQYLMPFEYKGRRYVCGTTRPHDLDKKYGLSLTPSLHSLKMGTCNSFSTELEWFAKELGISSKKIDAVETGYDCYQTVKPENQIRDMFYSYNIMNLDGREYKIDIAGALMAVDYKKKHPDSDIDPSNFVFVDSKSKNPFGEIKQQNIQMGD